MAIWNRLTSFVTGGAVATAAAEAMAPEFEVLKQTAWANEPHRVLDPGSAAELRAREQLKGVIEGIDLQGVDLANDAARSGMGRNRFDLLTELARTEPGVADLLQLRRRGIATKDVEGIPADEFRRLMRRQGYEAGWITEIEQLLQLRLGAAQVALGVVRSLINSEGLLVGENDTTGGKITPTPTSSISATAEAEANGIDVERLRVLINSIGLPMALDAAAQSVFRGLIEKPDFYLAVAQGDTRPAWADAIFEHARQIPSALDYINLFLRGWIDKPAMYAGTARHGMSQKDTDDIYLRTGRPIAPQQALDLIAREAPSPTGKGKFSFADFDAAIKRSDIRPEYTDPLHSLYHKYPPLFQLGRLAQANAIKRDRAEKILQIERYEQQDIDSLLTFWYGATTAVDPWVKRAETQLWSATHRSFLAGDATREDVIADLGVLGLSEAAQSAVVGLWTNEQRLIRARLTPTQVKKAWAKAVPNEATGQPWTREDAYAELRSRGWSGADANTFLDE